MIYILSSRLHTLYLFKYLMIHRFTYIFIYWSALHIIFVQLNLICVFIKTRFYKKARLHFYIYKYNWKERKLHYNVHMHYAHIIVIVQWNCILVVVFDVLRKFKFKWFVRFFVESSKEFSRKGCLKYISPKVIV